MILTSRPLRFLAAVVGGWIGARAIVLWPALSAVPELARAVAPIGVAAAARGPEPIALAQPLVAPRSTRSRSVGAAPRLARPVPRASIMAMRFEQAAAPVLVTIGASRPETAVAFAPGALPGIDPPPTFRTSRWSASVWAILRPDGRATPFASQLGGSQAGARIAYALDRGRRFAAYARISTAIDAREREGAVGLDWRPTRLPVHLVVEQRVGVDGVRGGTALGVIGGVGPTRLAGPVRIESYAQAGVILRDGREGFADGSVRMTIAAKRVDLGVGAWGGAQRGAARLDLGPTLGVTLPVERHALRLSLDWRRRVAGDARPGSGPAVSLGVDF